MHIANCPLCHVEFEIDEQSIALLQGLSHFKCPACSQMIPVAILPKPAAPPIAKALAQQTPAVASPVANAPASVAKKAWLTTNRTFLILGAATLLTMGAVGVYLATRPSGDISVIEQDVTTEVIRNQFFSSLIESGSADPDSLDRVAHIKPLGPSYIGMSADPYTLKEAHAFAKRVGAEVLSVESAKERSTFQDPTAARLTWFLISEFPECQDRTIWVMQDSAPLPRIFHDRHVSSVTTPDQPRRVFLQWWPTD